MPVLPGFCGPSYQAISPIIDDERSVNVYCEKSESPGAKTQLSLISTPGSKVFTALPEASVPGSFTINGRTFFAAARLWEVTQDGTQILRGDLGGQPTSPTKIVGNETQLLILNRGALWVFTLATNTLLPVGMSLFDDALISQIDFSDGYGLASRANSHTWQQSGLEDFTTWDGLDIATISLFPDNITCLKVDHRYPWFFSAKKSSPYYNVGAGFPVFIPIDGALIEDGCGAAFATVQMDNALFWLSQNERGFMEAKRSQGFGAPLRVSTHAVEFAWQNYPQTSDAVAYAMQFQGHAWWVVRFPSANDGRGATWVFDASTGYWFEWAFFNTTSGTYEAHHSTSHTFNWGKHLVGDWATGNVYELSTQIGSDVGGPLRILRQTPTTSKDNEFVYFRAIEFDVQTGFPPDIPLLDGNGQPRDAQIILSWSDDGGLTWSNDYYLNCGRTGQYSKRVRKINLGRARRRLWRVVATDPVGWRFANAFLDAAAGSV